MNITFYLFHHSRAADYFAFAKWSLVLLPVTPPTSFGDCWAATGVQVQSNHQHFNWSYYASQKIQTMCLQSLRFMVPLFVPSGEHKFDRHGSINFIYKKCLVPAAMVPDTKLSSCQLVH